jgi:hypothetical protein
MTDIPPNRVKLCPVCGQPGFLGLAITPLVRYCPDHAPGLSEAARQMFRAAFANAGPAR